MLRPSRILIFGCLTLALMVSLVQVEKVQANNNPQGQNIRFDSSSSSKSFRNTFKNHPACSLKVPKDFRAMSFVNRNLSEANLSFCVLSEANFTDAILLDSDFFKANLEGANLTRANMTGADIRGTNLKGAILYHTNLNGMVVDNFTQFEGARYDKHTHFPVTFVPEAFGLIYDE